MFSNVGINGKWEVQEVALIPVKRLKDRLLWKVKGYQDKYWEHKIANCPNDIIRVDKENHQIIIKFKEK